MLFSCVKIIMKFSHQSSLGISLVFTTVYMYCIIKEDKLQPDGPLGLYAVFILRVFLYINDPFKIRVAISFIIVTLGYKSTYTCTLMFQHELTLLYT